MLKARQTCRMTSYISHRATRYRHCRNNNRTCAQSTLTWRVAGDEAAVRAKALAERADDEVHLVRQPRRPRCAATTAVTISRIHKKQWLDHDSYAVSTPVFVIVTGRTERPAGSGRCPARCAQHLVPGELPGLSVLPGAHDQGGVRVVDGEQEAVAGGAGAARPRRSAQSPSMLNRLSVTTSLRSPAAVHGSRHARHEFCI